MKRRSSIAVNHRIPLAKAVRIQNSKLNRTTDSSMATAVEHQNKFYDATLTAPITEVIEQTNAFWNSTVGTFSNPTVGGM